MVYVWCLCGVHVAYANPKEKRFAGLSVGWVGSGAGVAAVTARARGVGSGGGNGERRRNDARFELHCHNCYLCNHRSQSTFMRP